MKSSSNPILEQIVEQSHYESESDFSKSCLLRGCFDMPSYEWNDSTMEEKEDFIEIKNY